MPSSEGIIGGEVSSMAQPQALYKKMVSKTNSQNILASDHHHLATPMRTPSCTAIGSNMDLQKQERLAFPPPKQQQAEAESGVNKSKSSWMTRDKESQKRTVGSPF